MGWIVSRMNSMKQSCSNVILIGYMASGKTTVGKALSKLSGWKFVDCDELIAQQEGMSCRDILQVKGETYFRQVERQMLQSIVATPPMIIATGGGMPCYQDNMQLINKMGVTYFLHRTPEDLALRLELTDVMSRPLLQGRTGEELIEYVTHQLALRQPYYCMAQHTIYAHGDDDEYVAQEIYRQLRSTFL